MRPDYDLPLTFPYPDDPTEALLQGKRFYMTHEPCPDCGDAHPCRYVLDGSCRTCVMQAGAGTLWVDYCPHGPHPLVKHGHNCTTCGSAPRRQAIERGLDRYIPKFKCRYCRTLYWRDVATSKCLNPDCVPVPVKRGPRNTPPPDTPRQRALVAGEKWYRPDTPCSECGTLALRYVANGRCRECMGRQSPDTPDTPRQRALVAGEKWYRPDTPCSECGTLALRYVANGRCRGCQEVKVQGIKMPRYVAEQLGFEA